MPWEATRPQSAFESWAFTFVGCANIFDVQSAAPDTTTCGSFHTSSAGTGLLVWKAWQPGSLWVVDSRFDFGVRIACQSMGASNYLTFEYSVNSGVGWNALITSVGWTNLAATTITKSLAASIKPSSMWVRMSETKANSNIAGRAQLWDVYLVGSFSSNSVFTRAIGDNLGRSDSPDRDMTIVRRPGG